MRIDYKNPIVNMCCRCLSIRDFKKVLPVKLPSHDSFFSAVKGMIIWSRYLLKVVTSALASANADFIQAKKQQKKINSNSNSNFELFTIIGGQAKKK